MIKSLTSLLGYSFYLFSSTTALEYILVGVNGCSVLFHPQWVQYDHGVLEEVDAAELGLSDLHYEKSSKILPSTLDMSFAVIANVVLEQHILKPVTQWLTKRI